ncbi:MAG: hypothetical protein R2716_03730 [Microthrixaceae bacterium]
MIDYVVTKVPRWAFEKLPGSSGRLGTQMQSVGEAMAIGRTFPESLQKALRSLENGRAGLNCDPGEAAFGAVPTDELLERTGAGTPERIYQLESLLRRGVSLEDVHEASMVDPWFLDQMLSVVAERRSLTERGSGEAALATMDRRAWRRAKRMGFSGAQLAHLWELPESSVRAARLAAGVEPTYKTVDTCAAEFAAETPYHYGTWEDTSEVAASGRQKVVILGSGPNRIGQGIEFDYCCVHACFALADAGYETVMVNCNPETVSTDYDTSDRLYFEPLTEEDVLSVIDAERRSAEQRAAPWRGHRLTGRPDPAQVGGRAARGAGPRDAASQHRRSRGPRPLGSLCARWRSPNRPVAPPRPSMRRWRWSTGSASRHW